MKHTEVRKKQIALFSYIVGIVAVILLANKIGDNGIAYFGAAWETYLLFFMLAAAFIPDALARLVRSRMSRGLYKNAGRMLKGALIYAFFWGALGSIFLWFIAELWMNKLLLIPYGAFSLQLLAPAFFINCFIMVLQGYFEGIGTAMPTAVSQISKQIFMLSFGLIICFGLYGYGEKVSALLQKEDFKAMYGSAGMAIGFSIAALLSALFLILVYMGAGRRNGKQGGRDGMRMTESCPEAIRMLVLTMLFPMIIGLLNRLPVLLGMLLFQRGSMDPYVSAYSYGSYYGKFQMLLWLAAIVIILFLLPVQNAASAALKREEYKLCKDTIAAGMQWGGMASAFFAIIFIVLGEYLIPVIFKNDSGMAAQMLRAGGVDIVFLVFGAYLAGIMLAADRVKNVVLYLLAMLFVYVGVLLAAMELTGGNVYSLVYARLAADFVFCILNAAALCRRLKGCIEWLETIIKPLLAAAVTGLIVLLLSKALMPVIGNGLGLLICVSSGLFCFLILLFVFRGLKEKNLSMMPGGKVLAVIGRVLHLL